MRASRVGIATLVAVLAVGTFGVGTVAANDAFAVVPEGMHVEAPVDDPGLEERLASALDLPPRDVRVDTEADTVEVLTDDVTAAEFAAALESLGVEVAENDVNDGPTEATVERLATVLSERYAQAGVDATVEHRGDHVLVDPEDNATRARELATSRGAETWALVPGEDGYKTRPLLTADDFGQVGSATSRQGTSYVPVTLTDEAGERFGQAMRDLGFAQEGGTTCTWDNEEPALEPNRERLVASGQEDRCLLTVLHGEVVYGAGVAAGLASAFRDGSFEEDPRYRTVTPDLETARELEVALRAGSLPAETTVRSPDEVSADRDGDGPGDAVTADGAGPGPLLALAGLMAALLAARGRRL